METIIAVGLGLLAIVVTAFYQRRRYNEKCKREHEENMRRYGGWR